MNQKRLLRLNRTQREEYIEQTFGRMRIQTLRHYVTQYGIHDSDCMSKKELLDAIVAGLNVWAEIELIEGE